jgi:hypothetical protein
MFSNVNRPANTNPTEMKLTIKITSFSLVLSDEVSRRMNSSGLIDESGEAQNLRTHSDACPVEDTRIDFEAHLVSFDVEPHHSAAGRESRYITYQQRPASGHFCEQPVHAPFLRRGDEAEVAFLIHFPVLQPAHDNGVFPDFFRLKRFFQDTPEGILPYDMQDDGGIRSLQG